MDPRDFGPALRRERERRGISLEQVAQRTKVKASMFAALERNDLSHWPAGIFRRSFVRGYAEAVGLDPDAVVSAFLRAFPESEDEATPVDGVRADAATGRHSDRQPAASGPGWPARLAAVLLECAALGLASAVAWYAGLPFLTTFGVLGIIYFAFGAVAFGTSPALHILGIEPPVPERDVRQPAPKSAAAPAPAPAPAPQVHAEPARKPEPLRLTLAEPERIAEPLVRRGYAKRVRRPSSSPPAGPPNRRITG